MFAATALPLTGGASAAGQTASYHIGNSLSWDAQPLGIEAMAAQAGYDHTAGYHILCNQSLEAIWNNPASVCIAPVAEFGTFDAALPNHTWDAVTIQPWRGGSPTTLASDTERILDFIDLTRSNPANQHTRFYIYTGWPDRRVFADEWIRDVPDEDNTPSTTSREYFDLLAARVGSRTDASVAVVPVGEVLYRLEGEILAGNVPGLSSLDDLYRDDVHLGYSVGRYVAGLTTFSTLFEQDPSNLLVPAGFYGSDSLLYTSDFYETVNRTVWSVAGNHSGQLSASAVPEPGAIVLFVVAAVLLPIVACRGRSKLA